MAEVSTAGAEAVARYFLDLYGYAFATGDLEEWRALSHPECIFCASVADGVDKQVAAGQAMVGGRIVASQTEVMDVTPGEFYTVVVDGQQEPWRVVDSAGAILNEQPATVPYRSYVIVVREGDAWLVRAVQVEDVTAE